MVLLVAGLFGCSATGPQEADTIEDPLEGFNRAMFSFNDTVDVYLLEPVAQGYDWIMPQAVQTGVTNVFENLGYPRYLVSSLIQGKFSQALDHTGRFLINSTVGLAGLVDVAQYVDLPKHEEDIGLALAYHGVPSGPYLVLPFFGPSNFRDTIGLVVDTALDPVFWVTSSNKIDSSDRFWISTGTTGLRVINTRARLLDAVEAAKESSLDYYLFVQGAYYQYREGLLYDKSQDGSYFEQKGADSPATALPQSGDDWWDDDPEFGDDSAGPDHSEADTSLDKPSEEIGHPGESSAAPVGPELH